MRLLDCTRENVDTRNYMLRKFNAAAVCGTCRYNGILMQLKVTQHIRNVQMWTACCAACNVKSYDFSNSKCPHEDQLRVILCSRPPSVCAGIMFWGCPSDCPFTKRVFRDLFIQWKDFNEIFHKYSTCEWAEPDLDSRLAYPRPRPRLAYPRPRPKLNSFKTKTKTSMSKTKTETQDLQDQYWQSMIGMNCDKQKVMASRRSSIPIVAHSKQKTSYYV